MSTYFCWILSWNNCSLIGAPEVMEYCSYESFHPACSISETIVMTSAVYGRMKEGRCLQLDMENTAKQDTKYIGCSADVLEFMDGKCSGRMECNVGVYDQQLRQKSSCYRELDKYLEASYACVSGEYSHLYNC